MPYDVIIGLEIHAELKTASKMFCRCHNHPIGQAPNTAVCPICLGHPGTLPVLNQAAVIMILKLGLTLNGTINLISKFDRKNYFYPDLPKGYQISQYDLPLIYNAKLEVDDETIDITRLHLEEDTGKLTHPAKEDYTLIDYNRSGTPLIEMVTEPVIKNALSAKKFCQKYQQILRYLEISDADMEKGQMRCEANISLQAKGAWKYTDGQIVPTGTKKLNPKVEIKNINSFKAVEKAINFEIERQTELLANDKKITAETRGWSDSQNKTISQRIKESSADYRYFPEPDIPPLQISAEMIDNIKSQLVELPNDKARRFQSEYGLSTDLAELLVSGKHLANWYEEVISELRAWVLASGDNWARQNQKLSTSAANWLSSELFKYYPLNSFQPLTPDRKVTAENFAELITLLFQEKINSSAGQKILSIMAAQGGSPAQIMQDLKLEQMDNSDELIAAIKKIIASNPDQTADYKKGKVNLLQFFVGQVMAETKGQANPKILIAELKKILNQ
ncbi:Asp-tRNA(Asn)/Glu-tRNA(Gln) amidotransferase subunit GatB [Candidatus Falkowbacteria bacterium CG_4_10_14_0_2_um_filter_41_15]|uniref:Aspartyl/glutamyl-tRNA(Asn/Gln) amidotransferase subunit B n=3 Tax=Candidatus Falkowiibacteriota TaxID=1752728 RepID=A0A1J4T9V0_9BACT|nr:MAG: glutaminyl-tRNA synthase (glutamine-hydrolyzing) subunit B [Candidatus Falkowbacteria bacterium CG1_02_41_21]PIZ10367.1 MAG: Asp-tRNA(Asn)/Glu-tRNA(Gln) amidotransferase subunit GatB [Candidatus Falkowbacteria bacterium CG_4_10_14_0_8_um_filter_41_36]PJA09409.1 MAG: Asp-tRNA(Asn)/Glu-tRNA(Gln) amidotransferase subunit GatB [Candidatus Falkowbacteria bacterium CG_4_10_14_0_2_um_filter_41_15]